MPAIIIYRLLEESSAEATESDPLMLSSSSARLNSGTGNFSAAAQMESRPIEAAPYVSQQNQVKRNMLQAVSPTAAAPSENKPAIKRETGGISKKTALLSEAFGLVASLQSVNALKLQNIFWH